MATKDVQAAAWACARRQHWTITRGQLLALGFTTGAVRHRLEDGRLHPVWPGVYAVGRPKLTHEGLFTAAVLACGDGAALSHESAAWLWGIVKHLVDLSPRLDALTLERAVNEAANNDLIDVDLLREDVTHTPGRLRTMLEHDALVLTDSELERLFLPIAEAAGLPRPLTQARCERLLRRLLLAGVAHRRGGRQPALPPHAGAAAPTHRSRTIRATSGGCSRALRPGRAPCEPFAPLLRTGGGSGGAVHRRRRS
jgi:hypothetical protein